MEKKISTTEVAKILGVSRTRILIMVLSGKIKGEKIGRDWLIPESETKGWKKVKHGTVYWLERK